MSTPILEAETIRQSGAQALQQIEAQLDADHPLPSVRRTARIGLLTVAIAFGGLIAWATLTKIDRAIIAQGNLIAEGRRKIITLVDAGVLRGMAVRDGDRVAAGQVLLRLDTAQAEALAEQARALYLGGQARLSRLRAEQSDQRSFDIPAEVTAAAADKPSIKDVIQTERRLFAARWEAFDGASLVQERQIAQLNAQLSGLPRQIAAAERQLTAIQERIRGFADLARTGVGSRFRVLELVEPEQGYYVSLAQMKSQQAQLTQTIAQAEAQLAALRLNRQQEIATDMQQTAASVAQAQESLRSALEVLSHRDVVAPEEGVVTNIQLFTPGSSILPGQTIMELVPANDRLIVEAHVDPIDIDQVALGQRANIRLVPYRQRLTPLIGGRVIHVAADQQTDPNSGPYFLVRIEMDAKELASVPGLALSAGMPTENYVVAEPRSVMNYLLSPVVDATRRVFRD